MRQKNDTSEPPVRSDEDERAYLLKRAKDHQQLSERSQEFAIKATHEKLRQLYVDRAERIEIVVPD